jgi:hypothetical protein
MSIIIPYLLGAMITIWGLSKLGWKSGTSLAWKITITILAVLCWPVTWLLVLLSVIDSAGTHQYLVYGGFILALLILLGYGVYRLLRYSALGG